MELEFELVEERKLLAGQRNAGKANAVITING